MNAKLKVIVVVCTMVITFSLLLGGVFVFATFTSQPSEPTISANVSQKPSAPSEPTTSAAVSEQSVVIDSEIIPVFDGYNINPEFRKLVLTKYREFYTTTNEMIAPQFYGCHLNVHGQVMFHNSFVGNLHYDNHMDAAVRRNIYYDVCLDQNDHIITRYNLGKQVEEFVVPDDYISDFEDGMPLLFMKDGTLKVLLNHWDDSKSKYVFLPVFPNFSAAERHVDLPK